MSGNKSRQNHPSTDLSFAVEVPDGNKSDSKCFDDDGRIKRTGTLWTASAHIITAVIGSGVLSLAWAIAQLGWIGGPAVLMLFSAVTYFTSALLAEGYRTGDPVTGKRNYTYMEAVESNLGGFKFKMCGAVQYFNLFGTAIGYTIAAAISMQAMQKTDCRRHGKKSEEDCIKGTSNPYMLLFGLTQIIFSQIPDFHRLWWLSIVAAIMSFTYSSIGLALGIAKVIENGGKVYGSPTGVQAGMVVGGHPLTQPQKIWATFQAVGNIAFAYSYSMILIEIQDTIRSPPAESKTMKKATRLSITVTTVYYMLCGCFGYAGFGDIAPGNLLTDGFKRPYWVLDTANAAVIIHLVGAYQVFCQPLYAFVEEWASNKYPQNKFIAKDINVQIPGSIRPYKLNMFRLTWRTGFVILSTFLAMLFPFFNDVLGLLGAIGFWPLTVFFPVEMYIAQRKIPRGCRQWVCLQMLSMACFVISIVAAAGSIAGLVKNVQHYQPFGGSLF